ncbi:kinase-like domain-containing protein [Protomyces lactucae-debilis]|uniref:non-specific serine/threonine protein kinase n=1 Tax=Protomyces lactucae-debilis TaxID=2754530 RepID=A0A1Y2FVC9_PROLT|nr:kinase-like domain-containing protein [Protomyces lactucae-debilis]ORY87973.1 kinase-like domain-containing protein [Protomyces lactucae-debilis]
MAASAADYNPDDDARTEAAAHHAPPSAEKPVEDPEDDMFADPVPTLPLVDTGSAVPARKMDIGVRESWADAEGYYRVVIGELLDERYAITSILGRGVFSAVVGATDQQDNNKAVAIKVTRNNAVMRKAGAQELSILRLLNDADPDDRKHIVRLKGTFEHREHFCLVFEHLALNLREVLRKFGRDVGIQVRAVRAYAGQLFLALAHLARHKVIHGDLKPDNILVSQSRTTLKLCDLGSASFYQADEKRQFDEATAYLASRFYRAPEVILGAGIDYGIDIWAAGCTLFEMYTGQILFPGRSNSAMLRLMMRLKGKMPAKMVRRGKFGYRHFDDSFGFLSVETDALSGQDMTKRLDVAAKPVWDLKRRCLLPALSAEERPLVLQLISLLERCLELDPARRLTAAEALRHPFLSTRQGI